MSTQTHALQKLPTSNPPATVVNPIGSEAVDFSTGKSACAPQSLRTSVRAKQSDSSVLDEPWRVKMLPSPDEARPRKSLPWKMGDVARLKDDSPEGMMKYIATHTTGWWQEMAERALRDTEKAQRMAEEAGWEPGQYWSLEVDAETLEKMRAEEEGRRQREEAERAKEQAEKEAFAKRQMELLEKAGKAPRCEYKYTDGRGCRAPQVKGERWCHGHAKTMSYRPEKLELEPMEDESAVMVNLYRVTKSMLSGRITEKMGGLMLWSVAIATPCVKRMERFGRESTRKKAPANRVIGTSGHREIGTSGHREIGTSGNRKTVLPQRARRVRRKGKGLPRISADGRGSGKKTGRELTRIKQSPQMNAEGRRWKTVNPGVTRRKSFRSGVTGGGDRRHRRHRATSPTSENQNLPRRHGDTEEGRSGNQLFTANFSTSGHRDAQVRKQKRTPIMELRPKHHD